MSQNRWIAVVLFALTALYGYGASRIRELSLGEPFGPRAFPILLAILMAAAIIGLVLERKPADKTAESAPDWSLTPVVAAVMIWTVGYFLAFEPVGYIISTAVYLAPLTFALNRGKWVSNIAVSVGFAVGTYILFAKLLETSLPLGWLEF